MAYLTAAPKNFVTPVPLNTARSQIEAFCKAAFPGSRPSRSTYNGRVSVSVNLGEGAYCTVYIDSRDLQPREITPETMPGSARVEVGGTMSGVNVTSDARGRAEMQRFFDQVTGSLQQSLGDFAAGGRARASRIALPRFPEPERGVA